MEFLQNIDPATLIVLALGVALLCGVLAILFFGLQIIGSFLGIFGQAFAFLTGIVSGGPASWCGCLVLIFGCGICGVVSLGVGRLVQDCPTNPVNFCRFLGY
jgi:hypothetical protein